MQTDSPKPAIFYVTTDTVAFLPLDFYSTVPRDIEIKPPEYQPMPDVPSTPIEGIADESPKFEDESTKLGDESPKLMVEKIEKISPEATYLMEARSIRSQNAKERYAWGQKVEKEIAPKILQRLGFTNIRAGNGRPIDIEAWHYQTHYLIDVKYLAQMPSIIRKLANLVVPLPEIAVSRIRKRKKEPTD